jgi:hypothetical protein
MEIQAGPIYFPKFGLTQLSDQFVAFVERKLTEAGIAKIVPPKDQLDKAYRVFARSERIRTIVEEAINADAGVIALSSTR